MIYYVCKVVEIYFGKDEFLFFFINLEFSFFASWVQFAKYNKFTFVEIVAFGLRTGKLLSFVNYGSLLFAVNCVTEFFQFFLNQADVEI